ncbi:hypothetical protein ACIQU6_33740 [Streptomyces sp. NPDC090442]|uniref:hypothetical protein n=1 Tax=Streptomyces sp. NPDC090442 TaxID=3365962 RepID=UPI00380DCB5C
MPAVPLPFTADQPFSAGHLTVLGTATAPLSVTKLTEKRLVKAIRDPRRRARPGLWENAVGATRRVAAEGGAVGVVRAVRGAV